MDVYVMFSILFGLPNHRYTIITIYYAVPILLLMSRELHILI